MLVIFICCTSLLFNVIWNTKSFILKQKLLGSYSYIPEVLVIQIMSNLCKIHANQIKGQCHFTIFGRRNKYKCQGTVLLNFAALQLQCNSEHKKHILKQKSWSLYIPDFLVVQLMSYLCNLETKDLYIKAEILELIFLKL